MSYTSRREMDLGAFEDDYRGFDMRDEDTARGPLILALALGVLLVFGAVVWNTYRQGVRPGTGDVPIIAAEASPFKRAPDERGGYQGADLNKRIYDQIDGSERDDTARPQPAAAGRDAAADDRAVRLQGGPPIDLRRSQEDRDEAGGENPALEQAEALETLNGGAESTQERQIASLSPNLPAINAAPEPSLPVPDPGTASPAASVFKFDRGGSFLVQIAALRSQGAAETAWSKATSAAPDTFRGAEKRIQRADLGAKGVFYRLRAGAFATRADAIAFCESLKADGGQCIVVTQ